MTSPLHNRFDPLPLVEEEIPVALRLCPRWVVWKAFPSDKHDGKAAKIPVDTVTGKKVSAFAPETHMSFDEAFDAHEAGKGDGIGIVLDGQPIGTAEDGSSHYLVGIDLDDVFRTEEAKADALKIVADVGGYAELSPSGRGVRIFCTSKHKPKSGQTTFGEIYAEKRFLTVTGHRINSAQVVDATEAIADIEQRWRGTPSGNGSLVIPFPSKLGEVNRALLGNTWPETAENIERLRNLLKWCPPDAPYATWRDSNWAIASLKWECGQKIAEEWSAGSLDHWQSDDGASATRAIADLFDSYDAERGITVGTLLFHAYANGMPRPATPTDGELPSPIGPTGAFAILSRDEIDALPPMRWTVNSVLPETGLAAIYGEPGSGKSFLAIDLAARISNGLPLWFGRAIQRRDVVYAALEGGRGIQQRFAAWDSHNEARADKVKFLLTGFTLLSDTDVTRLVGALKKECLPGSVVIIDTLSQATPGADENTGKDMGLVLQAVRRIAAALEGLVILVHHSGKDGSKGLRGHSSLNAAMDAVICVERDRLTGIRSWRVTKMKDAEDGATGKFVLDRVDLGPDGYGGRTTSAALKESSGAEAVFAKVQSGPRGVHQQVVLDALRGLPDQASGWGMAELIGVAKAALSDVGSRYRAARARSALDGLLAAGFISVDEGGRYTLTS